MRLLFTDREPGINIDLFGRDNPATNNSHSIHKPVRARMDPSEILICLQSLVNELKNKGALYDAHRVSEGMKLIRAQREEIYLLHGNTERRVVRRLSLV